MLPARLFCRPAVNCGDLRCERFSQGLPPYRATPLLRQHILSPARALAFRRVSVVCQAKANSKGKAKKKGTTRKASSQGKKVAEKNVEGGRGPGPGGGEGLKEPISKSSLMKLTKARLEEELELRQCETAGKKKDLVDRLYNAIFGIEDTKDPMSGLSFSALMQKKKKYLEDACEKRGIKKLNTKQEMVTAILEYFEELPVPLEPGTRKENISGNVDSKDAQVSAPKSTPDSAEKPTEQDLLTMTMVELRAICDQRGLPCAGKKALVVRRILASFEPEKGLDLRHLQAAYVGEEGLKTMTKAQLLEMFEPSGLDFEGLSKAQIIKEINRGFALAVETVKLQDDADQEDMERFVEKANLEMEAHMLEEGEQLDAIPSGYVETDEPPPGKALVGNVDQIINDLVDEVHRVYGQYLVDEDEKTEPSYFLHGDDDDDDDVWDALMEQDVISDADVRERLAKKRATSGGRFRPSGAAIAGDFPEPTADELRALEEEADAFKPDIDGFDANFDENDDVVDDYGKDDVGDDVVGKAFQEVSDFQDDEGIDSRGYDTSQSRKELFQGSLKDGDGGDVGNSGGHGGEDDDDDVISTGRPSRKRRRPPVTVADINFDDMLSAMEQDYKEPEEQELNKPIDTSEFTEDDDENLADAGPSSMLLQELDESMKASRRSPTFPADVDLFEHARSEGGKGAKPSGTAEPQTGDLEMGLEGLKYEELDFGDDDETSERKGGLGASDGTVKPAAETGTVAEKSTVIEVAASSTVGEDTAELDDSLSPDPPQSELEAGTESTAGLNDSVEIACEQQEATSGLSSNMEASSSVEQGTEESLKRGHKEEDDPDLGKEPAVLEPEKTSLDAEPTVVDLEDSRQPTDTDAGGEVAERQDPIPPGDDIIDGDPGQQGNLAGAQEEFISERKESGNEDDPLPQSSSSLDGKTAEPVVSGEGAPGNVAGDSGQDDSLGADVALPVVSSESQSLGSSSSSNGKGVDLEVKEAKKQDEDFVTVDEIKQKVEVQKAALRKVREETLKKKNAISEIKARIEASDKKQKLSLTQMKRLLEVTENIKAQRKSWQEAMEVRVETLRADADKSVKNQELKMKLESSIEELEGEFEILRDQVKQRNKEADALRESINRAIQENGLLPPSPPGFPPIGNGNGELGPVVSFPGIYGPPPTGISATSDQYTNLNGVQREIVVNPIAPISYDYALPPTVDNRGDGDNGGLLHGLDRGEQNLEQAADNLPIKTPDSDSKPQGKKVGDRIQDKSPILAVAALGLSFLEASGFSKLFGGADKKDKEKNDD